jgi:prepilin-type N-terminal cleavage/methylation domain-containing protein
MKNRGFTLAEVLITLGIIGVIAALTIPGLVASYQKKVLVTRMQKFYSVMHNAAKLKEAEAGSLDYSMFATTARDPDLMLDFFNINLKPYLQTISVKKLTQGIVIGFPDGSGCYMNEGDVTPSGLGRGHSRDYFCVNYRDCENIDEGKVWSGKSGNSRSVFYLGNSIAVKYFYYPAGTAASREYLKEDCANNRTFCAGLIQRDGWEIKDDYPW